jgi:hypothetical protein
MRIFKNEAARIPAGTGKTARNYLGKYIGIYQGKPQRRMDK